MAKLVIANWKMNGNIDKVQSDLAHYCSSEVTNNDNVIIALPSIYLGLASTIVCEAKLKLASQCLSRIDGYGAFTGEVSGTMLRDMGVGYSLIGHSERRVKLNESDTVLVEQFNNALHNKIIPVFCVGEDKNLRNSGKYLEFIEEQLGLLQIVDPKVTELIVAYEPLWAIGTGVISTISEIREATTFIHRSVQKKLPRAKITALYGGSVSGVNAEEILATVGVDGVLVGGASLDVNDFTAICSYA